MADAALVTSEAVIRMSKRPGGLALIARFSKVKLVEGHKPGASVQQGSCASPSPRRWAGRAPSSDRIMAAAGGR
uniref:DUF4908 domain-containing protein n=1 Tax=Phenylobacterium glaciei TaxID=2803784 RepID=A0A974P465_9CAUL|nr:DUF4908 domain-containing protein [Phenylobacterium glaciei]